MADGELTLKIDQVLADSLRARAEAVGQSVEEYALHRLRPDDATPSQGFGERDTPWNATPLPADDGVFDERDAAYWRELEAICDEADRTGGVPWEQVQVRLRNFGQKR